MASLGGSQRKAIRKAAVEQLLRATAAGERVQATRLIPWRTVELPAIALYTGKEQAEEENVAPREILRTLPMTIECAAAVPAPGDGQPTIEDVLDDLAEQVEAALSKNPYLGTLNRDNRCGGMRLTDTEVEIVVDGARPMGVIVLTYEVIYRTYDVEVPDPNVLADFTKAHTDWNLAGLQKNTDGSQATLDQAHNDQTLEAP